MIWVMFDIQDRKLALTPVPARTSSDLCGIFWMSKPMNLKEARQDHQNHLVDKLKEGQSKETCRIHVDTNVILRFLLGEPEDQAARQNTTR